MSSLKAKLFTAAGADAPLQSLLGTSPFRWYDERLQQGTAFPAVVVMVVSNSRTYAAAGVLPTGWARVQLTVYGSGNDSENAEDVVNAIQNFLNNFNAIGIPGLISYPNLITADRDAGVANTQPMTYQRILDVMIFSNSQI